jgi:hypothetical protein
MAGELEEIKGTLKNAEAQIRTDYKAEIIGLFGSYARGKQKKGSDLDVLVRFHEGATLFDFVGLGDFLEDKLCLKVDIVSERAIKPDLKDRILKEIFVL